MKRDYTGDSVVTTFAKNLSRRMAEKGVSYREMAKIVGVPHTTIYGYANALAPAPISTAARIASYLGVSVEWMITDHDNIY